MNIAIKTKPRLVPSDFRVPKPLQRNGFTLEILGPQHNPADYDAWTRNQDYISETRGLSPGGWPNLGLSLNQNEAELLDHWLEYEELTGFTYAVIDVGTGVYLGCVYLVEPGTHSQKSVDGQIDFNFWVVERVPHEFYSKLYWAICDWITNEWDCWDPKRVVCTNQVVPK